jgi:hypothetical protein
MPTLSNPKINDVLIIHDGIKLKRQMKQTAVQWFATRVTYLKISPKEMHDFLDWYEEAMRMEKEQRIMDYNAGHSDGLCNHINDADNYINEQNYA